MSKHTPGPWSATDYDRQVSIPLKSIDCERIGFSVCFVNGHREEEAKANARLIAAAPDLLEALKIACQFMEIASDWNVDEAEINGEMRSTYDLLADARATLAKAVQQ